MLLISYFCYIYACIPYYPLPRNNRSDLIFFQEEEADATDTANSAAPDKGIFFTNQTHNFRT